jgi:hypothetical protein
MPRDLLINAVGIQTGQWVRVEPPSHKTWPFRVTFTTDAGQTAWSVGSVILEELVGGLPLSPGPIQGDPGLLTAGSQTGGSVKTLGTFLPGSPDFDIDMPLDFIRARTTDGTGAVSVRLYEAE